MRRGKVVVIGDQEPEALSALKRKARGAGARLVGSASVVSVQTGRSVPSGSVFTVRCRLGAGELRLPLLGAHQVENCQTALAVLNELSWNDLCIKFNRVVRGLETVSIPSRCQVVRRSSLITHRSSLVYLVDSCHNPESGRALANVLRDHLPHLRSSIRPSSIVHRHSERAILVYGSLSGKLVAKTVAPLAPFVQQAVLVQPNSPRAMPLTELKRTFTRLHIPYVAAQSIPAALRMAQAQAQAQARSGNLQTATCKLHTPPLPIVIAGSFYLAGEVLKVLGPSRPKRRIW